MQIYTAESLTDDLLTQNIVTPGGRIIASQRYDNDSPVGWYFYNYDIRQSTTTILNEDYGVEKSYKYDEFGNTVESGDLLNEIAYTSAVSDSNTGLYYMNSRYYNPNTGRFLTQDSYKGNPYDPWTQHLYSYVGNNPVNMVDPTGHWAVSGTRMLMRDGGGVGPYKPPVVTPDPQPTTGLNPGIGIGEAVSGSSSGSSSGSGRSSSGSSGSGSSSGGGSSSWGNETDSFLEECGDYWYDSSMAQQQLYQDASEIAFPAALKALEMEFGIGGGMGGSIRIYELFGIDALVKADPWHAKYDDGVWTTGTDTKIALGGTLVGGLAHGGYNWNAFDPFDGPQIIEDSGYGEIGFNFALYFGPGIEIKIAIDAIEFMNEISKND